MTDLNSFADDSRIAQACQLIRAAVQERQQQLTGVQGPADELRESYAELLARMGELRGGGLYYRYLGSGVGNGALVQLADGSVKYDLISGIGVHMFGHSHLELIENQVRAALGDTVMQGNLQQNLDSFELLSELLMLANETGASLQHCFLSTSGATANENAIKILFQSRVPADRILTFNNCFSGRTMALAQMTDRPGNREGLPTTLNVDYVPFYDHQNPSGSIDRTVSRLRELLVRYPGKHAGMCCELIQGEGGYYTAPREFFVALFDVLREHDIPIFLDEIQTFGRTTRMFAFQHYELDEYADLVTIGKNSQVCATLFRDELQPQPGLISQTFTGATSAIHAARFLLQEYQKQGILGENGRAMQIHRRFVEQFERIHARFPDRLAGPYGLGGMIALTAYGGDAQRTKDFLNRLFDAGVIAFPAGSDPMRVRMLPPLLCLTDHDIDQACDIIEKTLTASA